MKVNTPITDAVATIIIMLALIAGGYFWLQHESDKIIQSKHSHSQEKSSLERLAPKTFEAIVKTTENEK